MASPWYLPVNSSAWLEPLLSDSTDVLQTTFVFYTALSSWEKMLEVVQGPPPGPA